MDEKSKSLGLLLIEDNDEDVRLLTKILLQSKSPSFRVEDRDRLATARERLREGNIDLILLDLGLPDSSGMETFLQIQAEAPDIPVIILTGFGDDKFALEALQQGAQDYLVKGQIDPRSMLRSLGYAIERKKIEKELKEANRNLEREIAERKRAEEAVRASVTLFRSIVEQSPFSTAIYSPEGRLILVNKAFKELWGVSGGGTEFLMEKYNVLEDKELENKGIMPYIKKGFAGEVTIIPPTQYDPQKTGCSSTTDSARVRWVQGYLYPVKDTNNRLQEVVLMLGDITDHMQAEEQIKASLAEKEVLLKEIHHRVKNNLQLINSLLNLQSRRIYDQKSRTVFDECKSKINSIALIHEKLYRSEDLTNINFGEYIYSLTNELYRTFPGDLSHITLKRDIDNVFLKVNKAIPCALIINELFTNALKYGFPPGQEKEGEIVVQLKSSKKGKTTLIVADNGVGLPNHLDVNETKSLGMQIVIALVDQLQGSVQIDRSKGTKFIIEFQNR